MRITFISVAVVATALFLQSCKGGSNNTDVVVKDTTLTVHAELFDYESGSDKRVTTERAFESKTSGLLCDSVEYGLGFIKRFKELPSFNSIDEVNVSFKCFMDKQYADATFVLSIDDSSETKNIVWEGKAITCSKLNDWSDVSYNFKINHQFITPESFIKLYVWNKGKNKFFIDDLAIDFVKIKK